MKQMHSISHRIKISCPACRVNPPRKQSGGLWAACHVFCFQSHNCGSHMSRLSKDAIQRQSIAGLWLLSDHFEATDPVKSIIFLQAALKGDLSESDEARTRVKVAQMMLQHTLNIEDAREHLNRAVRNPNFVFLRSIVI